MLTEKSLTMWEVGYVLTWEDREKGHYEDDAENAVVLIDGDDDAMEVGRRFQQSLMGKTRDEFGDEDEPEKATGTLTVTEVRILEITEKMPTQSFYVEA